MTAAIIMDETSVLDANSAERRGRVVISGDPQMTALPRRQSA
jgi:hypothetical protein